MKDLKDIKEAVVSYVMHLPYVKQLGNAWATRNRVTPSHWLQLVSALLELGSQLQ